VSRRLASACGNDDSRATTGDPSEALKIAKEQYWSAVWAGDLPAVVSARKRLIGVSQGLPDDQEAMRLIARSFAMVNAETFAGHQPAAAREDLSPDERSGIVSEGDYLERAVAASRTPWDKALNNANYSGTLLALGTIDHDDAEHQAGLGLARDVAKEFPTLGRFALGPKLMRAQKRSADFAIALEDMFLGYEGCVGHALDRAHPDLTGALNGPYADRNCGNLPSTSISASPRITTPEPGRTTTTTGPAARPLHHAGSVASWMGRTRGAARRSARATTSGPSALPFVSREANRISVPSCDQTGLSGT